MHEKQIDKQIDWINQQRREDLKKLTDIHESLEAIKPDQHRLNTRIDHLESEIAHIRSVAVQSGEVSKLLEKQRDHFIQSLETFQSQQTTSDQELGHLHQIERESVSRSLSELKNSLDAIPQIKQELLARREEGERLTRSLTEIQNSIDSHSRSQIQGEKMLEHIQTQRRQDNKRVSEISNEAESSRQRISEFKAQTDALQERALRNETQITEIAALEAERKMSQTAWTEQQSEIQDEQGRVLKQLQIQSEEIKELASDLKHSFEAYGSQHVEMHKSLAAFQEQIEQYKEFATESNKSNRLSQEQLRDDWEALLSAQQKKWSDHTIMHEEQWRHHSERNATSEELLASTQEVSEDARKSVQRMMDNDQSRLKELARLIRNFVAEYE